MSAHFTIRRVAAIVSVFAFALYRLTLAPSVLFIDSGELATVATTLGIAHPTGYPLFTIIGWIFAHLPIGETAVVRLNLMAATFCALGAGVMTVLVHFVLREASSHAAPARGASAKKQHKDAHAPKPENVPVHEPTLLIASAFAGLMLAYSQTFWAQATAVEVYALHCFLIPLTIYFFLRYCTEKPMRVFTPWGIAWAVTWGLSFANHMTTILLIPAFVWFFFRTFGWNGRAFVRGVFLLIPFAVGLSVYLYLPLRAAMQPSMNWGNPVNIENFIRHWTGKQYQVWMFTSFDAAGKQFKYFLGDIPTEFGVIGLIPVALGMVGLWRAHRGLFTFVAVLFATCVAYSINYDIHDIDSYFLLAYMASAMFCGAGAWWMMRMPSMKRVAVPLLAACVIVNMVGHYKDNDDSKNYLVHDYTLNLLNGLPQNAIVLSWQWDFFISASIYFQQVEHVRPDVVVIDKELLRRTWYLNQLKYTHPDLYEKMAPALDAFRVNLVRFEREEPYDPAEIEQQYKNVIKGFVDYNIAARPVFVTAEVEKEYTPGYQRIPEGLAFRLYRTDEGVPVEFPHWTFRDVPIRNYYTDKIREMYMFLAGMRGKYLLDKGKLEEAERYFSYGLTFQPKTPATAGDPTALNLSRTLRDLAQARDDCRQKLAK